jgi:hypothetical protein
MCRGKVLHLSKKQEAISLPLPFSMEVKNEKPFFCYKYTAGMGISYG